MFIRLQNVAKNIKTPGMKIYLRKEKRTDQLIAQKVQAIIEHTTLSDIVTSSEIYYDPDSENTIVREDQELIALYNDVPAFDNPIGDANRLPPWLLRFVLSSEKLTCKNLTMQMIERKLHEMFQDQLQIMHSDDNAEKLVLRLRMLDLSDDNDDDEETTCMYLKEFQDKLLTDMALKGIPEISKVTFSKYTENEFNEQTGKNEKPSDNWLVETDGVSLQKVLGIAEVDGDIDSKRTNSNDIQEILKVLGIEAVRLSLIKELRIVLDAYGIYVNYRHLSTLCDVMTQRGILTSITRHGINRVETGALRKCSFEETVEILYEAAVFGEYDKLSGITENIIMGQLAPYGTGCFDLVVDTEILQEFAQTKPDENNDSAYEGGLTPIVEDPYGRFLTPVQAQTPNQQFRGPGSEYSYNGTPNYQASMSPGPGMQSPGYALSPVYASPGYGGGGQNYQPYQSPIYQTTAGGPASGMMSPSHNSSLSPSYSPTNSRQSPSYNHHITPQYPATAGAPSSSPSYYNSSSRPGGSSSGVGSGVYNPGASSSSYSPTNYNASPKYSVTTHNYARPASSSGQQYSPAYSPTSHGATPRYNVGVSSPSYAMRSSGGASGSIPVTSSPGSNVYIPSSPSYNPAFQLPRGQQPGPAYQGGSPIDDSSSDAADTPMQPPTNK